MGGKTRDRERFPGAVEDINEDPGRYLDVDRLDDLKLAKARIRGIDYIAVLRCWGAVERQLLHERDAVSEHHFEQVMEWLDEREVELEEIGDRDERVEAGGREPSPPATWSWPDRDGEYPFTNTVDSGRYAADGGEER
ncbi:hypothetical protein [Haloplanus halophilus]|uniref:hypothetical protein n=1 Tax=Haloplanus halophilus TaxID=2949993 RepID=UPI00203F2AA1|nr:hypothetical protein [Haloplanus sp. GDY1]